MGLKAIVKLFLGVIVLCTSCSDSVNIVERPVLPDIFPDYVGVTVPVSIAPLNFRIEGDFTKISVTFSGSKGDSFVVEGDNAIAIPAKKWNKLLLANSGDSILISVLGHQAGEWIRFAPFSVYISDDPIDGSLVYRRIAPGYEVYSHMGIFQRELSNFDEKSLVENTLFTGSCMNCHTFNNNDGSEIMFHVRGKVGGTIIKTDSGIVKLNTKTEFTMGKFQYSYWHPSKKYIAYSVNKTSQTFHTADANRVEVFDAASDVVVYDLENNNIITSDLLFSDGSFETWPMFSADGRSLYFASASAKLVPQELKEIKYSLCRIAFYPEDGTFGSDVDTLINATMTNKSIAFPRMSPDGKYIMVTQFDYGNFPIWHKEADLYLLNLSSGDYFPLAEVNSGDVESYHGWSSNGRWFVFSSRRVNGLYTMPHIAYFGKDGKLGKPFLLPQKDPNYYDNSFYSFNIPEFVRGEVNIDVRELENVINSPGQDVRFTDGKQMVEDKN
ncbi:TolB family protein [Geofilum sp. OHC36d9]|uniref:TolB family protein n=1 Tax=Geofilum sp. OHC36d9 TaxID=3458413 RepID=UPI004033442A